MLGAFITKVFLGTTCLLAQSLLGQTSQIDKRILGHVVGLNAHLKRTLDEVILR